MTRDDVIRLLNGARAQSSIAVLALHACNARVRFGSEDFRIGPLALAFVAAPIYWERQGRPYPADVFRYAAMAAADDDRGEVIGAAENIALISMVAYAYELIKEFAEETNTTDFAYAAPWWLFARCVRNVVYHDQKIQRLRGNRFPFPISWRELTITDDMVDQPLPVTRFFTHAHAFLMLQDMEDYVRTWPELEHIAT